MRAENKAPAKTSSKTELEKYWMVFVPLDGPPSILPFDVVEEMLAHVNGLVKNEAEGWAYVFKGRHLPLSLGQTMEFRVGELSEGMTEEESLDGRLPGTELYVVPVE